jgi:hypothetical protein
MQDVRPDVAAAGKAIDLLIAEVERLQIELWHARLGVQAAEQAPDAATGDPVPADLEVELRDEARSVRERVRRLLAREHARR